MEAVGRALGHLDGFQQSHAVLGFPLAVMKKMSDDNLGSQAALITYYGLFALFPLLLLLTTILGFALEGHPGFQQAVLHSALANFPIIGSQLRHNVHSLSGSGLALVVGILGTLYGTLGIGETAQSAVNTVWNVPYKDWPGFVMSRLRGLAILALLAAGVLSSTALAALGTEVLHGAPTRLLALLGSIGVDLGLYLAAFMILTAKKLPWRDVLPGAAVATLFWEGLQVLGSWYVSRELSHASSTYGFFAIVIALMSWIYLAAELTLIAAEINVVHLYRLWPRSLRQTRLNDADRKTLDRLAQMSVRRKEMSVRTSFSSSAEEPPP
ncbi:MAG: YihY/virulence factor BrkB family protein [Actinobacteria bacterium]|nr:YihY/virulence factor BrkB family protein [Actinomycetota bacterium]